VRFNETGDMAAKLYEIPPQSLRLDAYFPQKSLLQKIAFLPMSQENFPRMRYNEISWSEKRKNQTRKGSHL
jgi:hypothetical protein